MSDAQVLTRFHLQSVWNWRTVHYGRLVEAPAYFIFLSVGLATLRSGGLVEGTRYIDYAYSGVLVIISIRSLFWALTDVANDRKWGVYAVSRLSGVTFGSYIRSILMAHLLVASAQTLLLFVLKEAVDGFSPPRDLLAALINLALLSISILAGCALGFAVNSYHMRDMLTNLLSLPLILSAPLFYVEHSLPLYLRVFSVINPYTYVVGLVRQAYRTTNLTDPALGTILFVLVAATVMGIARTRHELLSGEQG